MKVLGQNVQLAYKEERDGEFVSVAFTKSSTLEVSRDFKKVSGPFTGDSQEVIPGRKSWSITNGMFLSKKALELFRIFDEGKPLFVKFFFKSDGVTIAHTGTAYIKSIKESGNVHDMAALEMSLIGSGQLNTAEGARKL